MRERKIKRKRKRKKMMIVCGNPSPSLNPTL
jgi:hypothetical protein